MTNADVCCEDEGGEVDEEFEDGDAASGVEFHVFVLFRFAGLGWVSWLVGWWWWVSLQGR